MNEYEGANSAVSRMIDEHYDMDILTTSAVTPKDLAKVPRHVKNYIKKLEKKIIEMELNANDNEIKGQAC